MSIELNKQHLINCHVENDDLPLKLASNKWVFKYKDSKIMVTKSLKAEVMRYYITKDNKNVGVLQLSKHFRDRFLERIIHKEFFIENHFFDFIYDFFFKYTIYHDNKNLYWVKKPNFIIVMPFAKISDKRINLRTCYHTNKLPKNMKQLYILYK